jgi:valyl-tRNA synthetase
MHRRPLSADDMKSDIDQTFQLMSQIIYMIRNIRGELKLPPGTNTDVYIVGAKNDKNYATAEHNKGIISALIKANKIEFMHTEPTIGLNSMGVVESLKIFIPLPAEFVQQEQSRLNKESEKLSIQIQKIEQQLSNEEFIRNAPPALIEKQRMTLEQSQHELKIITGKLLAFK